MNSHLNPPILYFLRVCEIPRAWQHYSVLWVNCVLAEKLNPHLRCSLQMKPWQSWVFSLCRVHYALSFGVQSYKVYSWHCTHPLLHHDISSFRWVTNTYWRSFMYHSNWNWDTQCQKNTQAQKGFMLLSLQWSGCQWIWTEYRKRPSKTETVLVSWPRFHVEELGSHSR